MRKNRGSGEDVEQKGRTRNAETSKRLGTLRAYTLAWSRYPTSERVCATRSDAERCLP